jgi:hypothetical protein
MRSRCVKMQCGVASNPYGDRVVVRSKLVLRRRAYVTSLHLELMSVSTDTRRLTQMRFICAIHGVDEQVEKIPPPTRNDLIDTIGQDKHDKKSNYTYMTSIFVWAVYGAIICSAITFSHTA